MYRNEQRVGKIALIFSVLAIFIACLGLFGLANIHSRATHKRNWNKKSTWRKCAGNRSDVVKRFYKAGCHFICDSSTESWYSMHKWLQDFAYRINISWWIFVAAGLAALLIALATVSFQAIRAAITNPVKSLRTE